ncbi:hypothetical protein HYFRA_00006916 [Hymenoscyphus fraxineus]|uniref:HCP-like protein n=1 Tax=Hymenoscyphus fraxineus TaxID=746836 RepID=A0A9N9PQG2_9HELO|nr:hypothetical protein HYFRA_00006916 [Hymenoscyphus fraxineus]
MSTSSSPQGSPPGKATRPIQSSPPSNLEANGESKENMRVVPPPSLPESSGRIVGAPMSPVSVNVQSEDWAPAPSSAKIEAIERGHERQHSGNSEDYMAQNPGSSQTQELPYRPFSRTLTDPAQQPKTAIASSTDNPAYIAASNGSSPKRFSPDRIGENQSSAPVPQFRYHHQSHASEGSNFRIRPGNQTSGSPADNQVDVGASIGRHLTPTLPGVGVRRTSANRPVSAYSELGGNRGRSASPYMAPGSPAWSGRTPSANSHRSHDRPLSYVDLTNVSYPQAPPAPISLDNSQLRSAVGANASLLSMQKTLEMYRQNVKKLNDAETQYAFAIFLIQAAQEAGLGQDGGTAPQKVRRKSGARDLDGNAINQPESSPLELLSEAKHILQKLADRSYPFAQYYLADGYSSGLFSKGKEDHATAFPLFISASKHGHAESGYRAALCYEFGWGCRKDAAKAVQYYRQSASKNHPGAMTRLGRACLSGDLGLNKYREGLKWLKRATESADMQYNAAPYHLGLLYVTGDGQDVFQDETYAAQLFTQASDLGHVESAYIMGDAYEHGKLSCPRDPALSVHFYTCAAQRGHPAAMMALCAWYMVGAEPVLEKDENEAYEWARQAAQCGLTKAEYAVGYFSEMGIGCRRDPLEANIWYIKASESGDERAKHRLAAIRAAASGGTPMEVASPKSGKMKKNPNGNEKDCIIM